MLKNILSFITLFPLISSDKYSKDTNVIRLNWTNFDELVLKSNNYWLIKCHEGGNLNTFVNEFEKVGVALKGLIKVGEIFVRTNQDLLRKFNIFHHERPDPIFLFFDVDKNKYEKYYKTKSPRNLVNFVLETIRKRVNQIVFDEKPEEKSIDLTGDEYFKVLQTSEPWIIALLFPHEEESMSLFDWWDQMAVNLKGRVKVGHYDLTIDYKKDRFIHRMYRLNDKLEIICFPKGSKNEKNVQFFHGDLNYENVYNWALDLIEGTHEIEHLSSEFKFKELCLMKICVVFFLENLEKCPILCRHNKFKMLSDIAKKIESYNWNFLWVESNEQKNLEEVFNIKKDDYPLILVINSFKQTFISFKGSFLYDEIKEFFEQVFNHNSIVSTFKSALSIKNVPKLFPFEHNEL
nr:protein disulfide-isomerase 2-3-like [Onthophagus taurus]